MHDSRSAPLMPVHWLGVVAALLVSPLVLLGLALELALPVALGAVLLESVDVPPIYCAQPPVAKATPRAAASTLRVMTVSCVVGGTALPALQGRCRQADVRRKKLLPRQAQTDQITLRNDRNDSRPYMSSDPFFK